MAKAKGNFIGVLDDISGAAGATFGWSLHGLYPASKVTHAALAEGISADEIPDLREPSHHLRRAVQGVCGERAVTKVRISGHSGGWSVKRKRATVGDAELPDADFDTEVRVWLLADDKLRFEPETHPLAQRIQGAYDEHSRSLNPDDRSEHLIRTARALGAVNILRGKGGVVFLKAEAVPVFERWVRVFEACGDDEIDSMPTMQKSERAVQAVMRGVQREATKVLDAVLETVGKTGDAAPGLRALETQKAKVTALQELIADYADICGDMLDQIEVNDVVIAAACSAAIGAVENAEAEARKAKARK